MFPISDSISSRKFPFLTLLIIALTIIVFIQELTVPNPDTLIESYSLIPSMVDFTRLSTLIPFVTAIFLHGGFLHIASNLWFLWVFGDTVECTLGRFFYPALFLTAGVAGNLIQYLLMRDSPIPMLGASGAIAGVLGAYFVLFPYAKVKTLLIIVLFVTIVDIPASLVLGYWFLLQIISGAASLPFSGSGGVAFFAHVGGFLTGVIFAKIFRATSPSQCAIPK